MTGPNRWLAGDRPRGHDYDRRFEQLAADGRDMHGEAALVDSYGPMSVFDAGCGTGRVAIELSRRGHEAKRGFPAGPEVRTAAEGAPQGIANVGRRQRAVGHVSGSGDRGRGRQGP